MSLLVFLIVCSHVFCPRPLHSHQDPQRLPYPIQEVGATAQAFARWSESGRVADSAPNTGYEFKLTNLFSCTDPEHTPINIPDSQHNFLCTDNATVIPPVQKVCRIQKHPEANSSHQSSFIIRTVQKQGACHVSGRSGFQETGAELDRNFVATPLFSSQSKGKRDRDTNVVHSLKDRKSPKYP